ncbi:MAG: cellulose binding domain-containing protein [Chloroflexota bacterium]
MSPTNPSGECVVAYTANSWNSGFTAEIKITNNGSNAIQGWTLTYSYADGQQVTSSWNATVAQSGANVTATNPGSHWNGNIPANGGSVSFGVQGTHNGTNTNPASFVLNGMACNGGPIPTTNTPTATATETTPTPTHTGTTPTPTATATATSVTPTTPPASGRQMENLNRGLTRSWTGSGNFVSWRLLGTEPLSVSFNLYRGSTKVNSSPITNSTNYFDSGGSSSSSYTVRAVLNGQEQAPSESSFNISGNYHAVPLQVPPGGRTPDGVNYTYSANDASVGDLDGDGQYEIVLKWDPSNSKDNSQSGYTGNVYLDAYELNGTRLWRIDLGRNIRAGAHYTQFIVYDLDGDGKAEVACKTADGTRDGVGTVIGNANADYRNSSGYILSGPEFLTVFNGQTGAAMATTNYLPPRGNVSSWGDSYGNRVDRFLAGVAYLDGTRPSLIMARGYYTRSVIAAWDWRNGTLTHRWTFDTNNGYSSYAGQGNHQLSVADADADGKDEILYGAMAVNDNGAGLWTTGYGHGDAMHVSDLNPNRPGLEVWGIHEGSGTPGSALLDAATGATLWKTGNADVPRGIAVDIDPRYVGAEAWGGTSGLRTITNGQASSSAPSYANFAVWWDGDLLRELLNGDVVDKWNYNSGSLSRLYTLYNDGVTSNNGTKKNPALSADIFGDWREEIILRTNDSSQLRIFSTTTVTTHRLYTLMHDSVYRVGVAWQNVAYNQPPHTSYYLGVDMAAPTQPNVYVTP